jgi:hypothetical protein
LLVLHYFNWAGTPEEFKEFASQVKTQADGVDGIRFVGLYIPTSEWHYVIIWDVKTYEKVLQIYQKYSNKYGPLKISLGKLELFHSLKEIPFL